MTGTQGGEIGRFSFGTNGRGFLRLVNEDRILEAERSLQNMLNVEAIRGHRFLDIGSGSGLSSLAAVRLGAKRVHSFDFDPVRLLRDRGFILQELKTVGADLDCNEFVFRRSGRRDATPV